MGIFDKIGDILGDVVDGVVDFVDDVLGIELTNLLDNNFVKYGLMAASIFTGGVAIVNGVIQGAGAAAAAKGFAASFVEGAKGFVQGVASGIANPMKTVGNIPGDVGKLMSGDVAGLTGRAGDAARAASQAAGESVIANTPQDLIASGGDIAGTVTDNIAGASDIALPAADAAAQTASGSNMSLMDLGETSFDPGATDFQLGGMGPANASAPGFDPVAAATQAGKPPGMSASVADALKTSSEVGSGDFLSKMVGGAKDFATSAPGMQTIASMVQGYASGAAMEEQWNMMREEEERRRRSWDGFGGRVNTSLADVPSLRSLRDRNSQMRDNARGARASLGQFGGR
jgi:hypothetical protein